ncbi:MAG: GNAT family N-acetyltransferase [Candidatus Pacebacteria bacterium]|jgi:GNAT superfamily N-acetyltransferase|nr:GNAT family N-acetyltransferase [Candidatus Paceibacterota bacterium]
MLNIRKMNVEDMPRCAEILEADYSLPPYNEKFTPGVALSYIKSKFNYCAGHSFVAEGNDEEIVGFILTGLSVWVEGGQAIVEEIVVDPAVQGQGYGKALMGQTEKYLKENDIHSVILWGRKDAPAYGFHESNGFEDSTDWVMMHKVL